MGVQLNKWQMVNTMNKKYALTTLATLAMASVASASIHNPDSHSSSKFSSSWGRPIGEINLPTVQYSESHKFTIPSSLYDRPINEITVPGSHNSFNTGGTSPNCAPRVSEDDFIDALISYGLKASDYLDYIKVPKIKILGVTITNGTKAKLKVGPGDNKNVHATLTDQVVNKGLRFLEIDVYKASNGNWCVFHGKDGDSRLDGNSFYFSEIMKEIANAYKAIAPDPLFIKFDGGQLTESRLLTELAKHGLSESDIYRKVDGEPIPSINQLKDMEKRLVIVSGPSGLES